MSRDDANFDAATAAPFEILEPWDEHNRELAANTHPADWVNPRPADRYHMVVIGGGTAGLVTSAIAVALGARVAMVERRLLGGDCLNVGCVPSKAVLGAGRVAAARAVKTPDDDFTAAMERMRAVRAGISEHDSAARFRDLGVDVFLGDAVFTGPETVQVGDARLSFRRAVVATGTRPSVPPIPGLAGVAYRTNETIFSLTERPDRLVVIGGGPIGCELAQAFADLGTRVTILETEERILGADDPEAAAVVRAGLERSGVEVRCGAKVERIDNGAVHIRYEEEAIELGYDELLVAAGRSPNVEGMGLEAAGVEFDTRAGVVVDDRLATTNSKVYAIGDVAGRLRFTHLADAHARMVVRNALFYGRQKAGDLVVPWATYTSPELAHVGLPYEDIAKRGADLESVTVPFTSVDRARLEGRDEGFLRVHLEAGSDRIVAATIVGAQAGELISLLTQAMTAKLGLGALGSTIHPYPTRAEVVRKAADQWGRQRLTPTVQNAFGLYFRATR